MYHTAYRTFKLIYGIVKRKVTHVRLVKRFPAFYETPRSIAVFKTARKRPQF